MEEQNDLRLLVMKRAAGSGVASPGIGYHSPAPSPTVSYHDNARGRGGEPLIQLTRGTEPLLLQVGPDFTKLPKELHRVVLKIQQQAETASDCPMHGDDGHFSMPESRRGSRAVDIGVREQDSRGRSRISRSNEASEHRRGSRVTTVQQRVTRGSSHEPTYQSLPRRLSSQPKKIDRRQSFDFKNFQGKFQGKIDKFQGKVDFKNTLRSDSSKEKDQGRERPRRIRHNSEPKDCASRDIVNYHQRNNGKNIIDSDFDFRSPPHTRESSRERTKSYVKDLIHQQRSAGSHRGQVDADDHRIYRGQTGLDDHQKPSAPTRGQVETDLPQRPYKETDVNRRRDPRVTLTGARNALAIGKNVDYPQNIEYPESNPLSPDIDWDPQDVAPPNVNPISPRRVEFADQVFNFNGGTPGATSSRPDSRCDSPVPKSILRQTNSDPASRSQLHVAVRSNTTDLTAEISSHKTATHVAARSNTTDLSFCHSTNTTNAMADVSQKSLGASALTSPPPIADRPKVPLTRPTTLIIPPNDPPPSDQTTPTPCNTESLVKIMDTTNDPQTLSGQSNEKHETEPTKELLTPKQQIGLKSLSTMHCMKKKGQPVPPMLTSWSRSQSFPPAGAKGHPDIPGTQTNLRKTSDPMGMSLVSLGSQNASSDYHNDYDMIENENETLRDRVGDLEKRVHSQNDEITCLRATLADCLRRINSLESTKSHVQVNVRDPRPRRDVVDGHKAGPARRPMSGSYSSQDFSGQARIAHEAVNRKSALYQSTGSLHSDGHSSNSMSPAPSPSPTTPLPRHASPGGRRLHLAGQPRPQHSPMSGSMGNLHQAKKWSSTSDFRDPSPAPNNLPGQRRQNAGSLVSLRSPFGSQQNLDRHLRHGTKDAQYSPEDGLVRMFVRGRPVNLYAPTPHIENYSLAKVNPAPSSKLRLEWVYGYRGRDARANLYLLPTGEMVYFVAAVVVLYNVEEQSQRHYLGHTEDIKCIAIHPNKMLIATGQAAGHDRREGRPHIRVWNSVSLQTLHVLGIGDFERAISCLSFSKADGGNLLVAVDEAPDHNISIWDWQRGEKGHKITETKCSTETVVAAEFHPLEGSTVVTCGKGHVNFWQLDNSNFTLSRKTGMFDQRDKPKYVTCLAFSFTGDVLTGDSNGNVFIWGRGYNAVTKALRKIHDGPIFSICVLKDGSIVTGGGKDGRIVQFDTSYRRTGLEAQLPEHLGSIRTVSQGRGSQLLLGTTKNSILTGNFDLSFQEIMVGHVEDVWALATNPTQPQFITAGHDRMIHLWDSLSHSVVWSNDVGEQAQSACFSPDGEVIVVGTITGKWVVLDSRTREVFGVHQDGGDPVHTVKFSPDGQLLALGSRDNAIYMYQVSDNYRKYSRMGRCMGHSSYLTHLDWSTDSSCIQSNSAEHELVYWNASVCRPIRETATLRDVEWATGNCVISWATIGVWGETVDSPDINSVARSHDKKIIATGDDMGKIKLFSSPASQPKSLFHTYGGHSSQVTKVAFLSDDTRLISVGGRDTAIIQWVVSQ